MVRRYTPAMDTPRPLPPQRSLSLNAAAMQHLLQGADEHMPPAQVLGGLSGELACTVPPGMPMSIAVMLGHMTYWQEHSIGWLAGELPPAAPMPDETNFPAVTPEEWDDLVQRFLAGFERLTELAAQHEAESGAEFYKGRSYGFLLLMQVLHNTYHLAQIVLLRRMLGAWPPPET